MLTRPNKKKRVKSKSQNSMVNLYSYKVPNIVIVGDEQIRRKIQDIEKNFNLLIIFSSRDSLEESVNTKTIAIIIDEKKVKNKIKSYLETILNNHPELPIFYLSRAVKRPNFYTSLYQRGLQGIINWPREAGILHDLLIESLRPHPKATGESKGDEGLADMVKSHLVLNGSYKAIKVRIIEGFVFLEGPVKSLYDKEFIKVETSKVLGVKKVISINVKVRAPKNIQDEDIERNINMYIKNVLGSKKHSIVVKVRDNVATIQGKASTSNNILDIESFINKQAGIKQIIKDIKYDPSLIRKNVKRAKLLEDKVKNLFDGAKHISISVYGEYAEVSGTVKTLADRSSIERYVLEILAIKKLINKLSISGK
jgi:osmotically-inducible protein OsmY